MKKLAILSAVAVLGVLGFVGPASATGALELGNNQTIELIVECEPGWGAGKIDMHVDAFRKGGGPKFDIPVVDCISNEVQSHSPGTGAPATDTLGNMTVGTCDGANTTSLPQDYTVDAVCANVPGTANSIGVEAILELQADTPSGFVGLDIVFRCNIANNC